MYEAAVSLKTARQCKACEKENDAIGLLRDFVRCDNCGQPMKRRVNAKHRIRESWNCTNDECGIRVHISDAQLIETITILMNRIILNNQLLQPKPRKRYEPDARVTKVGNDIALELERDVPNEEYIIEKSIEMASLMLIDFSKYGSTFLVRRFDRNGAARIHFASAMTMLGKTDGASAADGSSYLELVSFIKANGAAPKRDLTELWKRIVFNMAVSNTDDHMRNHGFILKADGWHLSPLYDVNPVPEGDELSLCVNEDDATISLDLALEIAPYCEISTKDAAAMAADVLKTVRDNWNRLAAECGLSRSAQEYMRPAFSLALE